MRYAAFLIMSLFSCSLLDAQWLGKDLKPFYYKDPYYIYYNFDSTDTTYSGHRGKYEVVCICDFESHLVDTAVSISKERPTYYIFYKGLITGIEFDYQKGDSALVKDNVWQLWDRGRLVSVHYYDHGVDTEYVYYDENMLINNRSKLDLKTKEHIYTDYKGGILFSKIKYINQYFEVNDKHYFYYTETAMHINDAEPRFVVDLKKETSAKKSITLFADSNDVIISGIEYPESIFSVEQKDMMLNFPLKIPANDSIVLEFTYTPDTSKLRTVDTVYIQTDNYDYAVYCHTKACHLFDTEMFDAKIGKDIFYFSKKELNNNLLVEQKYHNMFLLLESEDDTFHLRGGKKNKPPAFKIDLTMVPIGTYYMHFGYDTPVTRILVISD